MPLLISQVLKSSNYVCLLDVYNLINNVKHKVHNLLQGTNSKLTSYLSDIFSNTEQALLIPFINGLTIDVEAVNSCLERKVKVSPAQQVEAMNDKLLLENRFLLAQSLEENRMYQTLIKQLNDEIQYYIEREFPEENRLLQIIPGVSESYAATILAEIGPTVNSFKTDGHLTSWAGLCLGSYESAGIKNLYTLRKEIAISNRL